MALFLAAVVLVATALPSVADARRSAPVVSHLASFGSGLGSGSTIGPDGALYVTDGNAGSILRIDRRTGRVTSYATGLPSQVLGIGGAMDVAFLDGTAYVLVTMVSGDIVGSGPFGDPSDTVGIYRLKRDGTFTVFADIGTWSVENPPPVSSSPPACSTRCSRSAAASWSPTGTTTGCCGSTGTARSPPS
jgi:hypothetical protein